MMINLPRGALVLVHRRVVQDSSGTRWTVTEAIAGHVPGALGERCLIFDSLKICRRFWSFPQAWAELPDAALIAFAAQSRSPARSA